MAIAGAAVPALKVWLINGKIQTGYRGSAHGSVVEDDMSKVYQRIKSGEKVLMHLYGDNYARLEQMVKEEI